MKKLLSLIMVLALTIGLVPGLMVAASAEDIPTIKWITPGNKMPDNYASWKAKLDTYLEEKIGVHIEMDIVPWGEFDGRRNVIVNTNDPDYDIIFTNLDTYGKDVNLGAFLPLDEMLNNTPELKSFIPENYWDAVKVNDKVYGVPAYKDSSIALYFVWDKAIADKYEVDIENIHTLAQLDEPLRKISEGEGKPTMILRNQGMVHMTAWYDKLGTGLPLGVRYDDQSRKVVPIFEQEEIMDQLKLMHGWYNDEVINLDAATAEENPAYRPFFAEQGWPMAAKTVWAAQMGVEEAVAIQWNDVIISNGSVQGSMSCISSASKNPEKALELLQLVNTDYIVRDALFYGEEGVDFTYVEGDPDHKVDRINREWDMPAYAQGTFFTASQDASTEVNQWDEVKALNESATPSVMLGFYFDFTQLQDEVTNCLNIWKKYEAELMTGTADPTVEVPNMMEEMRNAGFDKIVEEAQKQIDAADLK